MWPGFAGLVACFCALFLANGFDPAPLVWIGGIALVAAALTLAVAGPGSGTGAVYLACLLGLALWCGLTIAWSASPDASWGTTNRSLAYAAFAAFGVLAAPALDAAAAGAAALVAAVVGWALLAKCVPALYDYGDTARLRAPLTDWNMLAIVCVAAVPLWLWLARRSRQSGAVLLYLGVVALLLSYSRFGVALACLAAVVWIVLEPDRVESLATAVAGGGAAAGAFGVALALPGITRDGEPRAVRAHDGWIFALVVVAIGIAVALAGVAIDRVRLAPAHRRGIERAAAVAAVVLALAGLAVTLARAGTIWREFTNPVATQVSNSKGRLGALGSGNRWSWWQEAWTGFTEHPLGGTGAGTFQFTDLRLRDSSDVTAREPHNTPLQFLSETGIVGFLLYIGAVAAALLAAWRRRGGAGTALGLVVATFFLHTVVNYDWSFLGVSGPFLLLGGIVAARPGPPVRRPLLAVAATLFALGCVYSLAAPWLSQRAEARLHLESAHSYDPLSTSVLTLQAALADGRQAERLYRDALALEPTNSNIWLELAQFYAENGDWTNAYRALTRAYRYDPLGPAGQCGLAQQIRLKVGVRSSCRGAGLARIP
jgi:hypothetical protein